MYPVDTPLHGYLPVQALVLLHVGLALGSTMAAWRLGLPVELALPAFSAVGVALLPPFWPLYAKYHPTHD